MAMSDADKELMELQRSVATQGHAAGLPHGPAATDPNTIVTFEARRAAQREAWGQFVAIAPITIGNALAFVPGAQVPLEHVIKYDLEAQELVARVATPEQARVGKTFETDEEFHKANPHVKARQAGVPELHPSALDPRGGAAHLDTDGKYGPVVKADGPDTPMTQEQRDEKAGEVASKIVAAGAADTKGGRSSAGKAGA
jgi:hypothetical protein